MPFSEPIDMLFVAQHRVRGTRYIFCEPVLVYGILRYYRVKTKGRKTWLVDAHQVRLLPTVNNLASL